MAYAGVLDELDKRRPRLLSEVRHVAGTSAGALTALLLAFKLNMSRIREEMEQPLSQLLDIDAHAINSLYYYSTHSAGVTDVFLMVACVALTQPELMTNLVRHAGINAGRKLSEVLISIVRDGLQQAGINMEGKSAEDFTFRDLREQIAVNRPLRHLHVFATRVHPPANTRFHSSFPNPYDDVPIVKAVLASAAIPLFFQPQRIGNEEFYDGGLLHNFPMDEFDVRSGHGIRQENTLGFYFSNEAPLPVQSADWRPSSVWGIVGSMGLALHNFQTLLSASRAPDKRSVIIDVRAAKAGLFSFVLSDAQRKELIAAGRRGVQLYLGENLSPPSPPLNSESPRDVGMICYQPDTPVQRYQQAAVGWTLYYRDAISLVLELLTYAKLAKSPLLDRCFTLAVGGAIALVVRQAVTAAGQRQRDPQAYAVGDSNAGNAAAVLRGHQGQVTAANPSGDSSNGIPQIRLPRWTRTN